MSEIKHTDNNYSIKTSIYQAADKILNLAIYQLGKEKVEAYKEKLYNICSGLTLLSFADPLIYSIRFHELFPSIIIEKDKIIPILIYDILKPNLKSCQPSRIFSIVQEIKEEENIKSYFKQLKSEKPKTKEITHNADQIVKIDNNNELYDTCEYGAVRFNKDFSLISSSSSDILCVPNQVKEWLSSETAFNLVTNIDLIRNDHAASADLCDVLGLLSIKNEYIQCQVEEL